MFAKYVTDNYKDILIVAKRITRRRNHQAESLINETYLTLEKKSKVYENNDHFLKYFYRTMKLLYIGQRSTYAKAEKVGVNTTELIFDLGNDDWKDIEIVLDANEETIDTILSLSHLKTEDAIQYIDLMQFKQNLPPHEKEIFDLYFEKGLSSRDIAKLMEDETGWEMSYVRYNEMINKVKKKIHGSN